MDVSTSMFVEDLRPSRLEKARSDAARLLDLLDGDRVAVVAFAGSSATLCPLTLDYGAALRRTATHVFVHPPRHVTARFS